MLYLGLITLIWVYWTLIGLILPYVSYSPYLYISPSQNSPPEGNGVHFMFEVVSGLLFSEESDGADHVLTKGAQHAHVGPFLAHEWAKLKRPCRLT